MPIRKMRHISEATTPVAPRLRAENLRAAFELSRTASRLRPAPQMRGVRKYRSIEEASADRRRAR